MLLRIILKKSLNRKPDKLPPVALKDQDIVAGYLPEPLDTISVCNKFKETVADVNHTVSYQGWGICNIAGIN